MTRGVLWVSSRIVNADGLSPEKFCDWYENIHIQQVVSLPGIPSAARYSALQPQPNAAAWSNAAPWLTVYEMPDISYRNTAEFKGLDGQSAPEKQLLDSIFKNARFDTRFYSEVQVYENPGVKSGPAPFLISAALEPPASSSAHADFDTWYRDEHIAVLSRAPGYVRTRRYELVNGTTLDRFVRTEPEVPRYLALHEFAGEALPWKELAESAETEWARRVMGGLAREEVGWYVLKREYAEREWGGVGVGVGVAK